ncbi:ECF transporter S component [Paradesulfitobacterium ferrireducens]|uniref:ECF transporter S component n=1 Tax=Paradesulfitobacterium ferrireducens TaxID=2816476 RepID=UPI001A8F6EB8|nr:ECF transporter S component [Paradesulfitobacterium ferrireducens]
MSQVNVVKSVGSVRRIAIIAIFIALSAVGALIKIPSPVGTIGLDSGPGYFAALAFGAAEGSIVIAVAHMLTSAVVGFPLSIPVHLVVAVLMAVCAFAFRWVNRKLGLIPAGIAAIVINGVIGSFTAFPAGGMGAVLGIMPFLVLGSAINVIIAGVAYKAIKGSRLI